MAKSITYERPPISKPKWDGEKWKYYEENQIGYTYPEDETGADLLTEDQLAAIQPIGFESRDLEKYAQLKEDLKDRRQRSCLKSGLKLRTVVELSD